MSGDATRSWPASDTGWGIAAVTNSGARSSTPSHSMTCFKRALRMSHPHRSDGNPAPIRIAAPEQARRIALLRRRPQRRRTFGEHRGGFLRHPGALEEFRVLRAPQAHGIGENEVAEI